MSYWDKDFDEYMQRFFNMTRRGWFAMDPFFNRPSGDLGKEVENILSKHLQDIQSNPPKDLVREYESKKGEKVREIGPIVYGYSVTIGPDGKPKIREFGNVKNKLVDSKDNSITSSREPLIDIINNEKEVKVLVELPGVNKENIKINTYDRYVEVTADDERKYHQRIDLPADVDIDSAKSSYKNGILEINFTKKQIKNLQEKRSILIK